LIPVTILAPVIERLEAAEIPYMMVGSFVSSYHGKPRSTYDADIVIDADADQLLRFIESLPQEKYYRDLSDAMQALKSRSMFNVLHDESNWKFDFIFVPRDEFGRSQFARRQQIDYEGLPLFISSAEDNVIAKLNWAKMGESERQIVDVGNVLRVREGELDVDYIRKWVDELELRQQWEKALIAAEESKKQNS
jgi:hypothetical protein